MEIAGSKKCKSESLQDSDMVTRACEALTRMSYWLPNLVLPLVQSRFQVSGRL